MGRMQGSVWAISRWAAVWIASFAIHSVAGEPANRATWQETLVESLARQPDAAVQRAIREFPQDRLALETVADWLAQDQVRGGAPVARQTVLRVLDELGPASAPLRSQCEAFATTPGSSDGRRWAELYLEACRQRRRARLTPFLDRVQRVVFTKHYDLGGSHYAYTEGQSDAQNERHFRPGASLCLLEMEGIDSRIHTLLHDAGGVIRDPDVSYDGHRVLFAWKRSLDHDDYHLYEMTVEDLRVRAITSGLGFADYEGAYLPDGNLIFNSTRCVQTVDCWWTEVSNLFTCNGEGRALRQLAFDQVHTNYPTVAGDGRVIYTRWDYNDRGQIYPQALFQMNPDGTGQTELYGNNSWFPTTILHARAIPGSGKIVCIFTGHHTGQQGWLGLVDPRRGRQENQGTQLIAPVRDTPAVHVDRYGQTGDQFQHPYPLDEAHFLVAMRPDGAKRFGIYLVRADGRRELLANDPSVSCNQPVPLAPRRLPELRPKLVDYRRDEATVYLHDVYQGVGLSGIAEGTIRGLRVVALEFRAAGIGSNFNRGPAGAALASTPVSIEGAWDVKRILGTAKVYEDGSACFSVPARTPLYFQALDAEGRMVQSMRSWTSLQPGETASCVGCHEHKNTAPPVTRLSRAMAQGPQSLTPFHGPPRGFSFPREIQPILDRHCVRCHDDDRAPEYLAQGPLPGTRQRIDNPPIEDRQGTVAVEDTSIADRTRTPVSGQAPHPKVQAFSLRALQVLDPESQRKWSDAYRALAHRHVANWIDIQSGPPSLPPYHAGAARSRLVSMLARGEHYGVRLDERELDRFIAWIDLLVPYCGDYTEAMADDQNPAISALPREATALAGRGGEELGGIPPRP